MRVFKLAVWCVMLASGAAVAQGGSTPRGAFDGPWAIDVRTTSGPCGTGFGGEYSISGGRISGRFSAAGGTHDVSGTVSQDGAFSMMIGGPEMMVLTGQVRWRTGWGEWESANCTGMFMTNRR